MKLPRPAAEEPPENPPVELDLQQIALLDVLRRSGDQRASFADLRASGIEFPASIVEELELLGLPVERCPVRRAGSSAPGVRLTSGDPLGVPARQVDPIPDSQPRRRELAAARAGEGRWVAPALLAAVLFALVLSVAVLSAGSGGARARGASARRLANGARPPAATVGRAPVATSTSQRASSARRHPLRPRRAAPLAVGERAPAAHASELQARGHSLLESGQDRAAAARLSEAVAATGERTGNCIEPASETCLTYAYALYDLGRALAHEGRAAQAAAILEQRLRIDNQRPVVASALGQILAHTTPGASAPRRRHAHADAGAGPAGATQAGGVAAPVGPGAHASAD